jgi:hypothetical protein
MKKDKAPKEFFEIADREFISTIVPSWAGLLLTFNL